MTAEAVEPEALAPLWAFLERTAHIRGPAMLIAGVLWDYATLRIDRVFDNVVLALYLLVFGLCILVQLRVHLGTGVWDFVAQRVHWVQYLSQFLLGGLLSAYFIYYLHGAPLLRAIVWLLLLGSAAVFVEVVSSWRQLPELWVPLFGAVAFHFGMAGMPVLWGDFIGPLVPMCLAVLLSAGIHLLAAIPTRPSVDLSRINRTLVGSSLGAGAVVLLELFAWHADLIPPLPLTLMSAEIVPEKHEHYQSGIFWDLLANVGFPPEVEWTPGLRVEAKTPVFLPNRMTTTVVHVWEKWTEEAGWGRTDAIELKIVGGRQEGFRTYSRKRNLTPGAWRVRITTLDERSLGTVRFDLVEDVPEPADPPTP